MNKYLNLKHNIIVLECEYCSVLKDETEYIKDMKTSHPQIENHFQNFDELVYVYRINKAHTFDKEPENFNEFLEDLANKIGYVIIKQYRQTYPTRRVIFSGNNLNMN